MARRSSAPIEVRDYLSGVDYPVRKVELLEAAKKQNAPEHVLRSIEALPDREYQQPSDVTQEIGGP